MIYFYFNKNRISNTKLIKILYQIKEHIKELKGRQEKHGHQGKQQRSDEEVHLLCAWVFFRKNLSKTLCTYNLIPTSLLISYVSFIHQFLNLAHSNL